MHGNSSKWAVIDIPRLVNTSGCTDHGRYAGLCAEGYAKVKLLGVSRLLHRLVYCQAQDVPLETIKGMVVRHTCDNPRCINPLHLILGTNADNVQDMLDRGRSVGVKKYLRALSAEQCSAIRRSYIRGTSRNKEGTSPNSKRGLAKRYGVGYGTIHQVLQGTYQPRVNP